MSKPPSELILAARFALGEIEAARPATFLMAWETDGEVHVRTHPQSAALFRGLVMLLSDQAFPDEEVDELDE